jgi:hypothetical protein
MGLHYQHTEAQDFATNPVKRQSVSRFYSTTALDLMDLISQQWQLELAWAQRLRERIVTAQAQDHNGDTHT